MKHYCHGWRPQRARGRKGGRPKKLSAEKRTLAIALYNQKKYSIHDICQTVGISKPTLYAYIRPSERVGPCLHLLLVSQKKYLSDKFGSTARKLIS